MTDMIPEDWVPHRRRRDDELVGYLVHQGAAAVPLTLFGYALGDAVDLSEAQALLDSTGLSVLADPWWLKLDEGESVRVRIREVSPDCVVLVTDDFGYGGDLSDAWVLDVPDTGRLSR